MACARCCPPRLTARQREYVELIVAGLTRAQVAERLCVGESAVNQALVRMYHRNGAVSEGHLVAILMREGEIV